ncbi:hypothetical protein [Citrobacter freundii]|uniref:hypothetical protein n=1 Tax=Citrobacter freundii TaxID=546 RepID=UPI00335D7823
MSEFKGTPGPWFIADDALGNMTHIVLSKQYPFEMMSEENLALITAAPELLEALQDMLSGWEYIRSQHGDLYGVGWDRAQNKAKSAISKALGK